MEAIAGQWHKKRYEVTRETGERLITESYERSKDLSTLTVRTKVRTAKAPAPEIVRTYSWVRRE